MSTIARSYAGVLNGMSGRAVRNRVRKGQVVRVTGATCVVRVAGGPIGGVVPIKGYTPQVGDQVVIDRTSVVTYAFGAFTPP